MTKRGQPGVFAVLVALAAVASGLSAETRATVGAKSAETKITLLHWWTAPSELAALDALGEVFRQRHPGLLLNAVDARSHGGGARIFGVVMAGASAGRPPDAVFVNGGAPLQPYVTAGLLIPLDGVWKEEGLEQVVPSVVRSLNRIGDHYYAVPVGIHRDNLVWYNARLLAAHGIAPDAIKTWSGFFGAAEKLRQGGLPHPVQLASNWTLSLSLEGIVAGLGAATYQEWINGRITAPDDPRLVEALGILRRLRWFAPPGHLTTTWSAAIQRVVRGEAAFCLMGDWAEGEFKQAGLTYGSDYGAIPVPGTRGMYGVAVDSFAQPKGTISPVDSDRLLRVVVSRAGQDAFNSVKGSIPPRSDTDMSKYDAYQRSAIADFRAARVLYPNVAGATHDAFKTGLDNVMTSFAADGDVAKAAAGIAALAARSQAKFVRVWSLE